MANTKNLSRPDRRNAKRKARKELSALRAGLTRKQLSALRKEPRGLKAFLAEQSKAAEG